MLHQSPAHLAQLPTYDPETGELTAVIETPKGSRNKYDYDPRCAAFRLSGVLPEGMSFPYDFGFIPSTLPIADMDASARNQEAQQTAPGCPTSGCLPSSRPERASG